MIICLSIQAVTYSLALLDWYIFGTSVMFIQVGSLPEAMTPAMTTDNVPCLRLQPQIYFWGEIMSFTFKQQYCSKQCQTPQRLACEVCFQRGVCRRVI